MYKLHTVIYNGVVYEEIIRIVGNVQTAIPKDPANTDYQEYLEWLAEGNEPLPAENIS